MMLGRGLTYEQLETGTIFHSERLTVTEDSIIRFAFEWDPQPFHIDRIAAGSSLFGGLIGSGLHTLLISYRLYLDTGILKGTALAGLGIDDVRFLLPLKPSDTISVVVAVGEKSKTRHPDRGRVKLHLRTHNDSGEAILTFTINALVCTTL